ncbi:amidase [Acuticoccus kandeliae]|uniref:amidase n=1 Tax=Acuticoccus kandeliae TaxID=2073160 RepID=UPI000D3E757E|nr:amidase [Acuticoccus kandeliae]
MSEVWERPITTLAADIRAGTLTPVDLLEAYLDRIAARDGELKSYVAFNEGARAAAEAATKALAAGEDLGPLHGIPIAVKDNYTTAEMPTTAGSSVAIDAPMADSHAVAQLRKAGAVFIGKTRMHEFAWGMETPPTVNPFDTDRVPGGSSGGSGAALAAGLCAAALGSDTGGSIRIPASLCGTVGLKPTFGRIGRSGIVPHSWSLDHAGPLTTSVADAALLTAAMSGPDPADPTATRAPLAYADLLPAMAAGASGLKVGICRNHFFDGITTPVAAAVEAAIDGLEADGARIVEFTIPELAFGLGAIFAIELASSTAYHDGRLRRGEVASFAPDVRLLVEMGRFVTGADYLQAERYRALLGARFAEKFADVDVIVGPTMPLTAWRVGERTVEIGGAPESVLAVSWRLTYPWNLTGLPALSVPCGEADGLPIGLQIAGKAFDEASVLRAGAAVERRLGGPFRKA